MPTDFDGVCPSLTSGRSMSAIGPKRTSLVAPHMSAFEGKANMAQVPLRL
jgi:hypothetical protein